MGDRNSNFPNGSRYEPFRPPAPPSGDGSPNFFHRPPRQHPPNHIHPLHQPPLPQAPLGFPPPPPQAALSSTSQIHRTHPHHHHPLSPPPAPSVSYHHQRPPLSNYVDLPHHHSRHQQDHHPPMDEPSRHRRRDYGPHHLQYPSRRSGEFPQQSPRITAGAMFDNDDYRRCRSPLRLPRFDEGSFRHSLRAPIDTPMARPIPRFGVDHDPHHRSLDCDRFGPLLVRISGPRNEQDRAFGFSEEFSMDRRIREGEGFTRNRVDDTAGFFRNCRDGSHRVRVGLNSDMMLDRDPNIVGKNHRMRSLDMERRFTMRPSNDGAGRRDQHPKSGARSFIEPRSRVMDGRDGCSEVLEIGKTRVPDSRSYASRSRWEDAQDHSLTTRKLSERKSPFLRMEMEKPSFRKRNESSPVNLRDGDKETMERSDFRSKEERESSPVVSFKSNLLIVGPPSSSMVTDEKPAPDDCEKANDVLPGSSDRVSPAGSASKKILFKPDTECCRQNELSSKDDQKEPKVPSNRVVSLGSSVLHGRNSESLCCETSLPGKGISMESSKCIVSDEDNTASGSAKESSPIIRKKRKLTPLSISELEMRAPDIATVDKLLKNSSETFINKSDNCVKHFGKDLPYSELPHDEAVANCSTSPVSNSSYHLDVEKAEDCFVSGGSSVPNVKRRNLLNPSPCSSRQFVCSFASGGQMNLNSDEKGNNTGDSNREGSGRSQDVDSLSMHPMSVEKSLECSTPVENSTDFFLVASDNKTCLEWLVNEESSISGANTATSVEWSPIRIPSETHLDFSVVPRNCHCEDIASSSVEVGMFADSKSGKDSERKLSSVTESSGLEEIQTLEDADVPRHEEATEIMADNTVTHFTKNSADASHADILNLTLKQSFQGEFAEPESIADGASSLHPEVLDSTGGDLGLSNMGHVINNKRKRKLVTGSGADKVKGHDGAFLTLSSSASLDLTEDEVIVNGYMHKVGVWEPSVCESRPVNENELTEKLPEFVVPVSHRVDYCPPFLSPIKKRKFSPSRLPVAIQVSSSAHTPSDSKVPPNLIPPVAPAVEEIGSSSSESTCIHPDSALPAKDSDLLPNESPAGDGCTVLNLIGGKCGDEGSNIGLLDQDSCPDVDKLAILDHKVPFCVIESLGPCKEDETLSMATSKGACDVVEGVNTTKTDNNNTSGDCDVETGNATEANNDNRTSDCDLDGGNTTEANNDNPDGILSLGKPLSVYADCKISEVDMACDINIPAVNGLPSGSGCLPLRTDDVSAVNKLDVDSSVTLSFSNPSSGLSMAPKSDRNFEQKQFLSDKNLDTKSMIGGSSSPSIFSVSTVKNAARLKADVATEGKQEISLKTVSLPPLSLNINRITHNSSEISVNLQPGIKNDPSFASGKVLTGRPSFISLSSRRPTHVGRPRTWCRTDALPFSNPSMKKFNVNSSLLQKPYQVQTAKVQSNSYIRKGNSLVRNPASASSKGISVVTASVRQLNSSSQSTKNAPSQILKASPPCNSGLPSSAATLVDYRSSPSSDSFTAQENDLLRSPESFTKSLRNSDSDTDRNFEEQSTANAKQVMSDVKKVVYIKHKSNQLVAAPKHSDFPLQSVDAAALSSEVYYKRKRNQLVRAASETHNQQNSVADDGFNLDRQGSLKLYAGRITSKRQAAAEISQKTNRNRKLSLVWTLHGRQSPKKATSSSRYEKVLPQLLPWKRTAYWSRLRTTGSSSLMSNNLLISKKRGIIYTRSGFSLRRSKVVSIAGFSLKWSKSLEKRSKKVEKAVTLAAAALKRDKKETSSGAPSGERIYRFGMLRYKMDPSRRMLQRIPDEEPSSMATEQQDKEATKAYAVPKRLHIGLDEYIRIGNGNQLVRNPKKRTRILASEKVRWSLHTVRMRLAKKRKYCQFFTRFGKCNKVEGKCSYIHDTSKVAVCTKFLNDICSDPNCKLTHKVMPERMPDCSFFLQGMCSNDSCPYRHVNVNPKAAICENFLKGYCAEGNECRKKHSYMCPVYEATGECPEESSCKLYHPKKGKHKRKRCLELNQKGAWGRYFGSGMSALAVSEKQTTAKQCLSKHDDNIMCEDGRLADFISLEGFSDGEDDDLAVKEADSCDKDFAEKLQLGNMDGELVKPLRLFG